VSATPVCLAVPCRTDEPQLGRTLAEAWASWDAGPAATAALELLVCLNGDPRGGRALADLRAFAAAHDVAPSVVDVDAPAAVSPPSGAAVAGGMTVVALCTRQSGKAIAWNVLRSAARAPVVLFMDADVSFPRETLGLLLNVLDAHPEIVLASARTSCAARGTWFERVMAVPYAVDFPNLSPQLYAARRDGLPRSMPEALLDPERWLELTVGADRILRAPGARVIVRVPGTVRDFFWQRVRIEMAKVQLAAEHPDLAGRGTVQPGVGAVVQQLGLADLGRLGIYLALRAVVHAVAWRWYARGRTADVWRQPESTKQWGAP
jgi:hypothetical protein